MGTLKLRTALSRSSTTVSNRFIEMYMPRANGEYVKVYLLLLKACQNGEDSFSLASLADIIDCTEKDVMRAIRYWEKQGLVLLEMDDDNTIAGLLLSEPDDICENGAASVAAAPADTTTKTANKKAAGKKKVAKATDKTVAQLPAGVVDDAPEECAKSPALPSDEPITHAVSAERIRELSTEEDFSLLTFSISTYLKQPLTRTQLEHIIMYYDDYGFSVDLIEYLLEYCIQKNPNNFKFIDKVARDWYRANVATREEAKQYEALHEKMHFDILRAFGISTNGRIPTDDELEYMDRWLDEFGFSLDMIKKAASRTLENTGGPRFSYADSILSRWHEDGIRTLEEAAAADEAFRQKKKEAAAREKTTTTVRRTTRTTDFNRFDQRSYDYDELKKKLLKRKD
ncbi:MAG: DnaD domain protein [Lachnospiraceae bacterium]|nr:DnaD domain protein [Lachnospiraceae bacterium]